MGSQQLLLIVLGVIVVGVAIIVGINMFDANRELAAKDGVVADCTNLGSIAKGYYMKPSALGGGANDFTGWTLPNGLDTTAHGTFGVSGLSSTNATITGKPNAALGYTWEVQTTVSPTQVSTSIVDL